VDFGDPEQAHSKLFDSVKAGQFKAAISSALVVNNYLTSQSGGADKFLERFNQARLNTPVGETSRLSLEPDPVLSVSGDTMIIVKPDDTDTWLRKHCGYTGENSVLSFSFPLGIAIPKHAKSFNYKALKQFLAKPIAPKFAQPKSDAEELKQLFDLAIARFKKEQKSPPNEDIPSAMLRDHKC